MLLKILAEGGYDFAHPNPIKRKHQPQKASTYATQSKPAQPTKGGYTPIGLGSTPEEKELIAKLSPVSRKVYTFALGNPDKIPAMIDAIIGVQNAAMHMEKQESNMPLLAEANEGFSQEKLYKAWTGAGKPLDVIEIMKIMRNSGMGEQEIVKSFQTIGVDVSKGANPQTSKYNAPTKSQQDEQWLADFKKQFVPKIPKRDKRILVKVLKGIGQKQEQPQQ